MPSAIVDIEASCHRVTRGERGRVGRRTRRLHSDDADVGAHRLDGDGDPGEQSAAAGADDDRLHVGPLLEDLEADRALTRDDVHVVEGVDQHGARLGLEGTCRDEALVDRRTRRTGSRRRSRGWPAPSGCGAPMGMKTVAADAEHLRGEGDALRVVAGAGGDDAARPLVLAEPGDAGVGTADLERAGALQVLALEVDRAADLVGEPPRRAHRRLLGHPAEQRARLLDV